jgi:phosphatidylglycerol---prolipoprotein diacylglyceryl transferase
MHPVLFVFGSYPVRSYTVALVLAILIGDVVLLQLARREGETAIRVLRFCGGATFFALICGRLYHAALHPAAYLAQPETWLTGGLMAPGAILGVVVWTALLARWEHRSPLYWLDLIAPVIPLAEMVLRLGCLLNGCCYGRETTSPLGLYLPGAGGRWAFRFPTQIAYAVVSLLIFALLMARRQRAGTGMTFWSFLGLYAVEYALLDFWRADAYPIWGPLTHRQVVALIAGIVALVGWQVTRRRVLSRPEPSQQPHGQVDIFRRSWVSPVLVGLSVIFIFWTLGCGYRSVMFDVREDGRVYVNVVSAHSDDEDRPDCADTRTQWEEDVQPDVVACSDYTNTDEALVGCECQLRYDQIHTFNQNFQIDSSNESEEPALTPEIIQLSNGYRLEIHVIPGSLWYDGNHPMELSVRLPGVITDHEEARSDIQTTMLGDNEIRWVFIKAVEDSEGNLSYVLSATSEIEERSGSGNGGICPSALLPFTASVMLYLHKRKNYTF